MTVRSRYWRVRFARWSRRGPRIETPGYTVLVPVPGDLPVFLELALGTIRAQTARHRVATYVISDRPSETVTALVEAAAADWPGELRELHIGQPEAGLLPRLGDPGRNHGVQIITGLLRTRSTHVVLHDADLFLLHPEIHDRQYAAAVDGDLDVVGVSPSWDPWYAEHGRELAATWEMCARTAWFRRFPPWRIISHEDVVWGERHMFDTTFYAQTQTDPARIAVRPVPEIVHFNYVISTYRKFVWHGDDAGDGFVDDAFRLLLIRLISVLSADQHAPERLPSFAVLADGLSSAAVPVVYPPGHGAAYRDFRRQAEQILRGPWPEDLIAEARAGLKPFDDAYDWDGALDAGLLTSGSWAGMTPEREVVDVTVVIPVHDRVDLLAEALRSVAAQTVRPAAVVVVDDGSADGSGDVARAAGVTVIRHDTPRGPGAARNEGLAAATTTWVAFLDSDDLWAPDHLASLLRSARTDSVLVTAPGVSTTGRWLGNVSGVDRRLTTSSFLVPGDGIVTSGTMVHREVATAVGGFPEEVWQAEDAAMWLRLLARGPGVHTAHPTVCYRVHDSQLSDAAAAMRAAFLDVLADEAGPTLSPRQRAQHRSRLMWDLLRMAQRSGDVRGMADSAGFFARHPSAVIALGKLLAYRRQVRRAGTERSAAVLAAFPTRREAP